MLRFLLLMALAGAAAVGLSACATPYASNAFIGGGFDVKNLGQDVYRVRFLGNARTTKETVQTYWLYRSAELAIENGFTGFEILSDIAFVMRDPAPDERGAMPGYAVGASKPAHIPVSPNELTGQTVGQSGGQGAPSDTPSERIRLAATVPIFIYSGGGGANLPVIEGDIHLLKRPVASTPPKLFNAKALHDKLEPIIMAEKCGLGNVCPHVHEYLLPAGKLQ